LHRGGYGHFSSNSSVEEAAVITFKIEEDTKPPREPKLEDLKLYTLREVSALFSISIVTIRRRIRDGELRAVQFGKRGRYLIPHAEMVRVLQEVTSEMHDD
jgi:excisionase family DNA binding protein